MFILVGGYNMTYAEIRFIDYYKIDIHKLLHDENIDAASLFSQAKALDSKIASSIKGYKPKGIAWNSAIIPNSTNGGYTYNQNLIRDYLEIMYACLQGILNAIPYYEKICDLGEDVSTGQCLYIADQLSISKYIKEMATRYSCEITFPQEVFDCIQLISSGGIVNEDTLRSTLRIIIQCLETYQNSLLTDARDIKEVISENSPTINIIAQGGNSISTASAVSNVHVDIFLQIEQTMEAVKESCLAPVQEAQILEKLEELKAISQEKNRRTKWDKIKGFFQWLAEQSLQVAGWVIPLIYQILN